MKCLGRGSHLTKPWGVPPQPRRALRTPTSPSWKAASCRTNLTRVPIAEEPAFVWDLAKGGLRPLDVANRIGAGAEMQR